MRYPAVALCLILAVYSKEAAAIGIVPMLLLTDLLPRQRAEPRQTTLRRALTRSTPFVVAGAAAAIGFAVSVSLDTVGQIEAHLVSRQYEGFVKGGRVRGRLGR